MRFILSYELDNDDFIEDLLRIDTLVYDESNQGTVENVKARYLVNRESIILAEDRSRFIGYIAFFPITNELSKRIQSENSMFDDNIRSEDILPSYTCDRDIDLFLISIAVHPEYHGRGIGMELVKRFNKFVSEKSGSSCRIRNVYSYAVTDAGERLLSKAGFHEVKSILHPMSNHTVKLLRYCF